MTVNILGRVYTIKICKLAKDTYGECDTDKAVIRLNRRHEDMMDTLVHEVVHAILFESGIKHILESHDGLEEAIVRAIEHGLSTAELIRDFLPDPQGGGVILENQ